MPLPLNYQSKIAEHSLELKGIAERLLIKIEIAPKCSETAFKVYQYLSIGDSVEILQKILIQCNLTLDRDIFFAVLMIFLSIE